jgi:ABC-type glycerol-3-phosphate transport system substrate-binding protein
MKKVFSIFAIAGISAMLVACGGQSSQTSEEVSTDSTAVEAVDSTAVEAPATEVEAIEEAPASAE